MKVYKIFFNWVGMVMIGHDHVGKVRFGQVKITFMCFSPLWTYAENVMKIHQDLAMI